MSMPTTVTRPALHDFGTSQSIDWEQTDCLMCGSPRWSKVFEAQDVEADGAGPCFTMVRCEECGLRFTNPRPSPASIGRFYPPGYTPHQKPRRTPDTSRPQGRRRPLGFLSYPREERREPAKQGQCRLLDFGCGAGEFLQQMRRAGWQVTGMDASVAMVDHLQRELGIAALAGTLPHPDLQSASFDVVTMWHSLEHVHQPLEVLRHVRELLAPGGRVMISVPNVASGPFRWFGAAWYGLEMPRHLTHFSPDALRAMVQRAGFRVERVRLVQHISWLVTSVQRARQQRLGSPWLPWLVRRPLRKLVPWYCWLTRQSDCVVLRAQRR